METDNNPLISIVVPVYNLEQYVKTFVESLKAQTYTNFEAVIVNDGSKDNSLERIYQHTDGDSRFVVISTENRGLLSTRKTGIGVSKGQYITFLDADDILMPEVIERMVGALTEDCDVVCCNYKRICPTYESPMRESRTADMHGVDFLEGILKHSIFVMACGKLYKRELIGNITDYPLPLGEDSLLNLQIGCSMPTVRFIDYVGYGYLQRAGSLNHSPFDYNYMVSFCDTVEQVLLKHDDKLDGRAEFLALLNKLRWYRVYVSKSHNSWIGNSEFVNQIDKLKNKYKSELKRHYSSSTLLFLSMYSYRIMRPFLIISTTAMRLSNSIKRRMAK